jgi:hypothetical protein
MRVAKSTSSLSGGGGAVVLAAASKATAAAATSKAPLLPSPLETWEQQRLQQRNNGDNAQNGRRILPLPAASQRKVRLIRAEELEVITLVHPINILIVCQDSTSNVGSGDVAQSVRLMLSRNHGGSNSRLFDGGGANGKMNVYNRQNSSSDGGGNGGGGNESSSDQFASAVLPGDSFPTTEQHLLPLSIGISDDGDDYDDDTEENGSVEEREVLRRLGQSQARMEQVCTSRI